MGVEKGHPHCMGNYSEGDSKGMTQVLLVGRTLDKVGEEGTLDVVVGVVVTTVVIGCCAVVLNRLRHWKPLGYLSLSLSSLIEIE